MRVKNLFWFRILPLTEYLIGSRGERFPLVISGHAHNLGGKWVKFGESIVINCAVGVF